MTISLRLTLYKTCPQTVVLRWLVCWPDLVIKRVKAEQKSHLFTRKTVKFQIPACHEKCKKPLEK